MSTPTREEALAALHAAEVALQAVDLSAAIPALQAVDLSAAIPALQAVDLSAATPALQAVDLSAATPAVETKPEPEKFLHVEGALGPTAINGG